MRNPISSTSALRVSHTKRTSSPGEDSLDFSSLALYRWETIRFPDVISLPFHRLVSSRSAPTFVMATR
jgi:hypothetical protein